MNNWTDCPKCGAVEHLREDYEVWMDKSGELTVVYNCVCRACGWKWNFRAVEQATGTGAKSC